MRAGYVFSEVLTGLRRNITMTIAMILTTAISLGLLGGGLMALGSKLMGLGLSMGDIQSVARELFKYGRH